MYRKGSIKYFYRSLKIQEQNYTTQSNMIPHHDIETLSYTSGMLVAYEHVVRSLLIDHYNDKYEFPFSMDAGNRAIELIFGGTE